MKAQSKLTVLTRPWHANFTETNHLGSAFLAEPHKFDKVLTRVFTASRLADNPLTAMTKGMGRTSEIESFDWEWELMGIEREELEKFFNRVLKPHEFKDYCPNGLQIEGKKEIKNI